MSGKPFVVVALKRMDDGWHWSVEIRSNLETLLATGGGIYSTPPLATYEEAVAAAKEWFNTR